MDTNIDEPNQPPASLRLFTQVIEPLNNWYRVAWEELHELCGKLRMEIKRLRNIISRQRNVNDHLTRENLRLHDLVNERTDYFNRLFERYMDTRDQLDAYTGIANHGYESEFYELTSVSSSSDNEFYLSD